MPEEQHVPNGFEAFNSSPFLTVVGPLWVRRQHVPPTFGLRIKERHTDTVDTAHGAILVALADLALGHHIRAVAGRDLRLVTAGLTVHFDETRTGR
jgi:acyl-coenzyme A thioesterase PaaI-like protein